MEAVVSSSSHRMRLSKTVQDVLWPIVQRSIYRPEHRILAQDCVSYLYELEGPAKQVSKMALLKLACEDTHAPLLPSVLDVLYPASSYLHHYRFDKIPLERRSLCLLLVALNHEQCIPHSKAARTLITAFDPSLADKITYIPRDCYYYYYIPFEAASTLTLPSRKAKETGPHPVLVGIAVCLKSVYRNSL